MNAPSGPLSLADVGAMDRERFVAAFGALFEGSPWVAERAFAKRPFAGLEDLHGAMVGILRAAGREELLALIRAHPDLAGRAGLGELSGESAAEQAAAGLDRCTVDELARFHALNDAYAEKFGFPFILAVKESTKAAILGAFEERLGNEPAAEFERALAEIAKIAHFRLSAQVTP